MMLYSGAFSSSIYPGRWCVLAFWQDGADEVYDYSEPTTYEDCQARLLAHGQGVPWQEGAIANTATLHRVTHGRIVPAELVATQY